MSSLFLCSRWCTTKKSELIPCHQTCTFWWMGPTWSSLCSGCTSPPRAWSKSFGTVATARVYPGEVRIDEYFGNVVTHTPIRLQQKDQVGMSTTPLASTLWWKSLWSAHGSQWRQLKSFKISMISVSVGTSRRAEPVCQAPDLRGDDSQNGAHTDTGVFWAFFEKTAHKISKKTITLEPLGLSELTFWP